MREVPVLLILFVGLILAACSPQDEAMHEARRKAWGRAAYVQQNDIEFRNYDRRQRMSDDPNAILWCTSAFPIPSSPIFTVAVVGKLTSGGKRPFPDDPGPDGMYGRSGDYRYGFTPGGIMADWYNLPVFCTTEPTVWQRNSTTIVMEADPRLKEAQKAASDALKRGDADAAYRILSDAINQK